MAVHVTSERFEFSRLKVSGASESFVCFGPLVMDGYGICYNIRERDLILGLSSMISCRQGICRVSRQVKSLTFVDIKTYNVVKSLF